MARRLFMSTACAVIAFISICIFAGPAASTRSMEEIEQRRERITAVPAYGQSPICLTDETPVIGDHLKSSTCSGLAGQLFNFNGSVFSLAENSAVCITVGTDDDPDSDTPSLELRACNGSDAQIFNYNTTSLQLVHTASGMCVDLDADDTRVELYDCNVPVSSNQQWNLTSTTGGLYIQPASSNTTCLVSCTGIAPGNIGKAVQVNRQDNQVIIGTNTTAAVNVTFFAEDVFRISASTVTNFDDSIGSEIVVSTSFDTLATTKYDANDTTIIFSTSVVTLIINRDPILFTAVNTSNGAILFAERQPLLWNTTSTRQTLYRGASEHFYGGGMQNGYFSHRDAEVLIQEGGGWSDGGRANPAPFYMSTYGYGVLRNTYAPGQYNFLDNATYSHDEAQFDGFYFVGDLKRVLDLYTQATGRPFMPPIWGLTLGDSDCYNANNRTTTDVIAVARNYSAYDIPGGWMIPNDGYGCGYTQLPYVIEQLHDLGKYTALWTSTGLDNATWEIGTAGSRGIKTDVGWVGAGYKFELDAVKLATALIEDNTQERRYIWTVCGWAGTHAYAVMWNGDNGGSWEYIRFQIPTVLGSGLSAQAHTSGDIDGIFGGSAETYVRDIQWKCFLTVLMSMSGWAKYNKQPWQRGEPYTSYSRKYLKLKMRLLPYQYTYSHIAHTTGLPPARATVLEYPNDPIAQDNTTAYQFFSGEWFLVAPVYQEGNTRDGIYLPADEFVDYWTGTRYQGPQFIDGYNAPLDILPVFVKAGAIIPMWPAMNYFYELPRVPITLDIYPATVSGSDFRDSMFTMYEDDGLSRDFEKGAFALQNFTMHAEPGFTTLDIWPVVGSYSNMNTTRSYEVTAHLPAASIINVMQDSTSLPQYQTLQDLELAAQGYVFDPTDRSGTVTVKILPLETSKMTTIGIRWTAVEH
eukprot:m.103348 g.103348  ORF g.103348 m.103348 type:complete len:917 (-) comp15040_c1_seq1:155-2905(-)